MMAGFVTIPTKGMINPIPNVSNNAEKFIIINNSINFFLSLLLKNESNFLMVSLNPLTPFLYIIINGIRDKHKIIMLIPNSINKLLCIFGSNQISLYNFSMNFTFISLIMNCPNLITIWNFTNILIFDGKLFFCPF